MTPASAARVRLGIVGCGAVTSAFHAPALQQTSAIDVKGLFDLRSESARSVAAQFPGSRLYDWAEEIFADGAIDAVGIFTPPSTHFALASAAIRAGKHVLVEKPIALSSAEAGELVTLARESGVECTVGYHLRQHRLVRRAREAITSHRLGRICAVHSIWSSSMFRRVEQSSWRAREQAGGNLLYELGVHHLDLWRYLLREDLHALHAEKLQVGEASARVQLVTRSHSGVLIHTTLMAGKLDCQEIEIIGERGKIQFSLYDAFSYREQNADAPQFGMGARLSQLRSAFAELPEGLAVQLRGGDLPACFRAQWEAFATQVLSGTNLTATFQDGLASLDLVERAYGSSLRQIDLHRQPASAFQASRSGNAAASGSETATGTSSDSGTAPDSGSQPREIYGTGHETNKPLLSVVLASPDRFESLKPTLAHLRRQTIQSDIELVFVAPERSQFSVDPDWMEGFRSWQLVHVESMPTIARGNAAGVRATNAELVVFAEDHSFPEPEWAQALVTAHRGGHAVVAPVVRNANPDTAISWADYMAGYGPWIHGLPERRASILPGHNSCYARSVLDELGDELEDHLEAEAVLHGRLRERGYSLLLEPRAVTAHVNFALFESWISANFFGGRVFAGVRSEHWGILRRLTYCLLSPAIPYVRLGRSLGWMRQARYPARAVWRTVPHLWLGLTVDALGQMLGYASGAGSAHRALAHFEFHRSRHIPISEREALFDRFERS